MMKPDSNVFRPAISAVQTTPFHARTARLNLHNRWEQQSGFTVPGQMAGAEVEYSAAVRDVGIGDVSDAFKYLLAGRDLEVFLKACTRDLGFEITAGRCQTIPLLDDRGQVIDMPVVIFISQHELMLRCSMGILPWLRLRATGLDVRVEEVTFDFGLLRVLGPVAGELLSSAGLDDVAVLEPGSFHRAVWDGMPILIERHNEARFRTTIWAPKHFCLALWDKLILKGRELSLQPVGKSACELLRVESETPRVGLDYASALYPSNALAFVTPAAFEKNDTWNKLGETGFARICINSDYRPEGAVVYCVDSAQPLAAVTSVCYSYQRACWVGFALLPGTHLIKNARLEVRFSGETTPVDVFPMQCLEI